MQRTFLIFFCSGFGGFCREFIVLDWLSSLCTKQTVKFLPELLLRWDQFSWRFLRACKYRDNESPETLSQVLLAVRMWKSFVSVAASVSRLALNHVQCILCKEGQLKRNQKENSVNLFVVKKQTKTSWNFKDKYVWRHLLEKRREVVWVWSYSLHYSRSFCRNVSGTVDRKVIFLLRGKFMFISFRLPLNFLSQGNEWKCKTSRGKRQSRDWLHALWFKCFCFI